MSPFLSPHSHHIFFLSLSLTNRTLMAVEAQYHHLFNSTIQENPVPPFYSSAADQSSEVFARKRPRDALFSDEDLSSQIHSHMLDVDRLITQHVANATAELCQKRRRFSGQIIAALNESVSKQIKCKDEEIEQLRRLNWAMEERVKNLVIESNAWRYLAQSHEAAAGALRQSLERVLAEKEASVDDAESCCGGDEFARDWRRVCRGCGEGEPSVLLLPCRHLCLCSVCGPVMDECPVCGGSKTGSVNVNLC